MLAKDETTVRNYLVHARKLIKEITKENKFTITKRIKFGPRYFVAEGLYKKKKSVFKFCLYPQSYDHLTNEKFSREILFLNFIKKSKYSKIRKSTPHIYASNIETRAWYIREFLNGQVQNINNGNIRFVDSFFTTKSYKWFFETVSQLQKIKNRELPANFKKILFPPQSLEYLWRFIGHFHKDLDKFIKHPGATKKVHKMFIANSKIYSSCPHVLAHQEIYSPHILISPNFTKLIDWENIGWALPTHDIVTMWMRAHKHPAWQQKLKHDFLKSNKKVKNIKKIWDITILMQSTFNVISYYHYYDKKDFYSLAKYSGKLITGFIK